jgi:outer membrane receptor protein involved in Fe transport
MNSNQEKLRLGIRMILAASLAVVAAPAFPQTTATSAAASTNTEGEKDASSGAADALGLDEIVVTAAAGDKSRLRSSISVSDISAQAIQDFTPRSEAEVFRNIPGIRAEDTAGPGGNSNITVRGLPIVTGGSEFVQLQEDGLPTVLFGDMNFGNNDYWVRFDDNVARVEAVRGGSSSTLASQAPGAVINYISDTGDHEGGLIRLSKAINYTENRVDFTYGGPISDTVRFHVGGFVKDGNGPTNIGYTAEKGYQIKANITKEINDGKGYIRFNFKRLDDQEPTFSNMPSLATVSGKTIGNFSLFPGFDARSQSNQSIYNQQFQVLENNGTVQNVRMQGIHPKATAVGGEFHNEFSDNFSVDDKFRYTDMSGVFITQFVNVATTASFLGTSGNIIKYANGPNQGKVFTGSYVNTNPNIDTNMSDMGNWVNDLGLTGRYEFAENKMTARAGWFHMNQTIAQDWHVNPSLSELSGSNPAQLDVFSAAGAQLTAAGQAGFNNNWGNCCARAYNLTYADDAPYLSFDDTVGKLDLDASVRFDSIKAQGYAQGGVNTPVPGAVVISPAIPATATTPAVPAVYGLPATDNLGSAVLPYLIAGGPQEVLDYKVTYTSWSLGALYAITDDLSAFARASRGGRFNADRKILSGNFNADGSLNRVGATQDKNIVLQQEIGVKNRGAFMGATYNAEGTFFRAQTADSNYDLTNQISYNNVYHSWGLEADGGLRWGNFMLTADVTYTHAVIAQDATGPTTGNTPLATPKFIYLFSPSYDIGFAAVGVTIDGQSAAYTDNTDAFLIEGQTFVNLFAKLRPYKGLEIGLNINNVADTIGYRGRGSLVSTGANTGVFQNSAVLGRTIVGTISYRF